MPEKIVFTKARIEALPLPLGERAYHYDAQVPGLCVCVTSAGTKTYYCYRWINGRPVRERLGKFDVLSLDDARSLAKRRIGQIAAGENPQAMKLAARHGITLNEAFAHFLEHHAKPHKKQSSIDEDNSQFERYLGKWKNRKLTEIRRADVQALHARMGKENGIYAANRLRALLHVLFEVASQDLEFKLANPCRGVRKFKEQSRDRFLQADELPRFFAALKAEPNPDARDLFTLAILTGARKSNLLTMRWGDLDLASGTWNVPDTKANEPQKVVLSHEALAILQARQRHADAVWVFPGHVKGTPLRDPYKWWYSILERAGIENLRIHDLRRTLGSWQAAAGASLPIIGKSLGHKQASTTAVYARLNLDPVRASVATATAAIMAAANAGDDKPEPSKPATAKPKGAK